MLLLPAELNYRDQHAIIFQCKSFIETLNTDAWESAFYRWHVQVVSRRRVSYTFVHFWHDRTQMPFCNKSVLQQPYNRIPVQVIIETWNPDA